jgi:hypothetical protein
MEIISMIGALTILVIYGSVRISRERARIAMAQEKELIANPSNRNKDYKKNKKSGAVRVFIVIFIVFTLVGIATAILIPILFSPGR